MTAWQPRGATPWDIPLKAYIDEADSTGAADVAALNAKFNRRPLNVKDAPFNAVGDGVANDYAAVQAALDAAAGKVLHFPPGTYLNANDTTPWEFPNYTRITSGAGNRFAASLGGATLIGRSTRTADLAISRQVDEADYWAHGLSVEGVTFRAANGQVSGSGFRACPGEAFHLTDVSALGFPDAGVVFQGAMAPTNCYNINVSNNKRGIWFDGRGSTVRGMVNGPATFYGLSGDDNEVMIHVDNGDETNPNVSGGQLSITVINIKAETSATGPYTTSAHNPLVKFTNPNAGQIELIGGFITNMGNTDAVMDVVRFDQNGGLDARSGHATLRNVTVGNYDNLIRDLITNESYPWFGNGDDWGVWRRVGEVSHRPLHIIRSTNAEPAHGFVLRGSRPQMRLYDAPNDAYVDVISGAGAPEGVVSADIGSLYLRNDGGFTTPLAYIKLHNLDGAAYGWVPMATGSQIEMPVDNATIKLGKPTVASFPEVRFRSRGIGADFDSRIFGEAGTNGLIIEAGRLAFFSGTPVAKPTVTGAKGGNAALASLLTALADLGLITDSTS